MNFHVYMITCNNGKRYCGFTSRSPYIRLEEHLQETKNTKFYKCLRESGLKKFEVIASYEQEIPALIREIREIHEKHLQQELNTDSGGQGRDYRVKKEDHSDGTFTLLTKRIRNNPTKSPTPTKCRRKSSRKRQKRRR